MNHITQQGVYFHDFDGVKVMKVEDIVIRKDGPQEIYPDGVEVYSFDGRMVYISGNGRISKKHRQYTIRRAWRIEGSVLF